MQPSTDTSATPRSYALGVGLPWILIIGLAALGVPRVVLHDLHITDGFVIPGLLAVAPPVIWVVVVHRRRARNPAWTCASIGILFGLMLAITHQLLWSRAFEGGLPELGGNLSDLDAGAQELVLRIGAFMSSNGVGLALGLVCGLIAWVLDRNRALD